VYVEQQQAPSKGSGVGKVALAAGAGLVGGGLLTGLIVHERDEDRERDEREREDREREDREDNRGYDYDGGFGRDDDYCRDDFDGDFF
jgi:hypothetical protein